MKIVVKVGTSTLAHPSGLLNIRRMEHLVKVLSDLKNAGHQVILVSSGAIGMGLGKLGESCRPEDIPAKQAAAAVGQCELMYTYDRCFEVYNHTVAQVLITREDIEDPQRKKNFENTMAKLLDHNVLPIVNENDTIATEEIQVGDNDTLGAIVAVETGSDILVILSDVDGMFTADPRKSPDASLIDIIEEITPEIDKIAGGAGTKLGTGGMATKLEAARLTTPAGCDMVIINGNDPEKLYDIVEGRKAGTRFLSRK